ncbi:NIL domain-containing protein [Desulfopila sp. IMCC35008]|uniref:NIL domain-containing protein n=1 Tax=Desulfopila sp. IMCC35008 TaxID=2653858 RepID=UPI0013D1A4C6|nr:NIL domain-containing protein [Desulfopila sp. IMCC35008]
MITQKVFLYFPKSETEKPIVYQLVKEYNLVVNIYRAKVTPEEEGYLSLEITGTEEDMERAYSYLNKFEVNIQAGNVGLHWDPEKCAHCGNCIVHCPTGALHYVDKDSRTVDFNEDKCVECLACLPNCPFAACSSAF